MGTAAASYGNAVPMTPRFNEVSTPPTPTALEEIRSRLAGIQEQVGHLGTRLAQTADRAGGPIPTGTVGGNGNKPPQPVGTLGDIYAAFETIHQLIVYAHEQASRVERIA